MSQQQLIFVLKERNDWRRALAAVAEAPVEYIVTISPPKRTSAINAKFHAMCSDFSKSGLTWAGKARTALQWKVLLVSGHATATNEGSEMLPGLEGEFINIRESTALMSVKRGSSLIDYTQATGDELGVRWSEVLYQE